MSDGVVFDAGASTEYSPVNRQFWACFACGTKRQWGTARLSQVIKAASEADEVVNFAPILYCEKCHENREHVHSHDEGGGGPSAVC